MAKFTFILTIFLITFSLAEISRAEPNNDVIDLDIPTKKTLLLPSDNPNPEETSTTVGFSEILPENDETKTNEVSEMPRDHPMKIIRFHPINRHFPRSQLGSLRVPLHGCRHGGMGKPMRPRQVSFGDDMMVPSGENEDFDPMVQVVRQVPERWIRIHRHHPHHLHHHRDGMPRFPMGKHHDFFADKRFGEEREERFRRGKRHEFFANQRFGEDRDGERFPRGKHHDFFANQRFGGEERDGEREERQDGGFMRSVRKFLNSRF